MDINKMREDVIAVLNTMDIPYEVGTADIVKINDLRLYGVVLKEGDLGKTIYINDFADSNATAAEIAEQLVTICETTTDVPPLDIIGDLTTAQTISDIAEHLHIALIGDDRNEEFLDQVISRSVGSSLSFICQIRYDAGEGFLSTTITKELAESNRWDIEELFDLAVANTAENDPAILYGMSNALFMDNRTDLLSCDEKINDEMLILSNRSGMFGAAALFLPDIVDRIHDKLQEGFFAIPSSVHEFLVIPESSGMTMAALRVMCREANESIVKYNEVLSDNVLYMPYNG